MKQLTRTDCADYLRSHDNFCILTHRKPDGDTLGSAAALCRGLRAMGKTAHVLRNPETTPQYAFLQEDVCCEACSEDRTVISVDVAADKLFPPAFAPLLPRIALKIDHHGAGSDFAPLALVDPGSAACGEIVWDLLRELGVSMDRATAEAVYTAVSTDTGCFRFSNTTAHTLHTAAACLEAGAQTYPINKALFETTRLCRLKIESYLADHLEFLEDGKLALALLPREVEQACGVTEDDLVNISNFARNIEGVMLAATFRTESDGATKISLRSAPGYNSAAVSAELGGGGHAAAAGVRIAADQAAAREKLLEILKKQGYLH